MVYRSFIRRNYRIMILIGIVTAILVAITVYKQVTVQKQQYQTLRACSYLTQQAARSSVGGDSQRETRQALSTTTTTTTFCTYRTAYKVASLAIRSPRNATGAALNQDAFDNPPLNSQRITALGDRAYWTPSLGQLNVLKNDQWYIVSAGPLTVRDRNIDEAKKLAETILK